LLLLHVGNVSFLQHWLEYSAMYCSHSCCVSACIRMTQSIYSHGKDPASYGTNVPVFSISSSFPHNPFEQRSPDSRLSPLQLRGHSSLKSRVQPQLIGQTHRSVEYCSSLSATIVLCAIPHKASLITYWSASFLFFLHILQSLAAHRYKF